MDGGQSLYTRGNASEDRRALRRDHPFNENSSAPAERFRLPDGAVFGIIASTTTPFCRSCDRSRLTADGLWYLCLYAQAGIDLRQMVRAGAGYEEIAARIASIWRVRSDRGAELRAATGHRGVLVGIEQLRKIRIWKCTRGVGRTGFFTLVRAACRFS